MATLQDFGNAMFSKGYGNNGYDAYKNSSPSESAFNNLRNNSFDQNMFSDTNYGQGNEAENYLYNSAMNYNNDGLRIPSYSQYGNYSKPPEIQGNTEPTSRTNTGSMFDGISNFGKKYGDSIKTGLDIFKAYGDYQTGEAQRKNAQNEIEYRNRIAALNEKKFNRDYANQAAMQNNAQSAFESSALNKNTNYYGV